MSNLNKKSPMDAVKRFLFDNKVILMFVVLSIACIMISGANVSYVAGEVFSRFGRNTCLVLALIIPCMAGLGMNFGIVVGAIAAQISIFWVVHWGFTGITAMLPSEDETAELYDFARKYLEENGFKRYEVSNFAKDGFKSRHNLNYWQRGEYIGFGVSASSFIKERRFTNTEKIDEYTACILRGRVAEIFSEEIEGDEREFEYIMLNLRKDDGFLLADFKNKFNEDFTQKYADRIKFVRKYLDLTEDYVRIKPEYIYVQNTIIIYFMD